MFKFTIVTPTYKRSDKLIRAVNSVLAQTYQDWELIIVNDSPTDNSYKTFPESVKDSRIHYHLNEINKGVNYSRNLGMDKSSADSTWTIFLDDDDYLAPNALQTFHELILKKKETKWFITNRAYSNGKPVTNFPSPNKYYSYIWDCLLLKRGKGDVTHCIETKILTTYKIRYSTYIKQAEEWIFYYQLSLHQKFYYHDHNSTITDGYDTENGLNFRKRTKSEQLKSVTLFIKEGKVLGFFKHPTFWIYLLIRFIRSFLKQ